MFYNTAGYHFIRHFITFTKAMSRIPRIAVLYALLSLAAACSYGQAGETGLLQFRTDRDTVLVQLGNDYRDGVITTGVFLRRADSLVRLFPNSRDLPVLLALYQKAAWQDEQYRNNRPRYFLYMAMYHVNYRDLGSGIFYYRKALETAGAGPLKQLLSPYIGLTNINLEFHNTEQAYAEYGRIAPFLGYITGHLPELRITPEELAQVAILLANGCRISAGRNDLRQAYACYRRLHTLCRFADSISQQYAAAQQQHFRLIGNKYFLTRYTLHQYRHQPDSALGDLHHALAVMAQGASPDEKDMVLYIYSLLIRHHLAAGNTDSAGRYIALFGQTRALANPGRMQKHDEEQRYFLYAFYADLYEQAGNAPLALFYLRKAIVMQDSIYERIMADYNNSLYAKTQVAYDREQLMTTELEKNAARRFNLVLLALIAVVVAGGILGRYRYRVKQQQRFVRSKLELARNIHDEIAPMLLYSKMLLRSGAAKEGRKAYHTELEAQISKTLESVRFLAHELKADRQHTLGSFAKHLQEQLRKNERINRTRYILETADTATPLTAYQHGHLVNIASELIANTIKHAACRNIRIQLAAAQHRLTFAYADDGKGFARDPALSGGIGLSNIRERVEQLKGEMNVENNYPDGYRILMYIPLS